MDIDCVRKKIELAYFSGTGGTSRAAACLKQSLEARGCEVKTVSLEKGKLSEGDSTVMYSESYDIIIVVYPVHAFDAPEVIYKWIDKLPNADRLPAAVISVSGGGEVWPNTASRAGCIKALERKGYSVFYERMLNMPSNIFIDTHDHLAMHLLKCLPIKAEHCVQEILGGVRRRKRPPISAKVISAICKLEKPGARMFGRKLSVTGACNGCSWCEKNCPQKNIHMENGKPMFGGECIACLRCFYGCPKSAIQPRTFRFFVVKKGYDLDKLEERMAGVELEPVEKLAKGAFAGLLGYLQYKEL